MYLFANHDSVIILSDYLFQNLDQDVRMHINGVLSNVTVTPGKSCELVDSSAHIYEKRNEALFHDDISTHNFVWKTILKHSLSYYLFLKKQSVLLNPVRRFIL